MRISDLRRPLYEQLELKPVEWNGKNVVWTDGVYYVAVNNLQNPSFITVWTEDNKKVGRMTTDVHRVMKEPWIRVSDVSVDRKHQGNRLAVRMYQVLLTLMPQEYAGLAGYEPDIVSNRVIKIYKRMGAINDGDYWFVRNPNRA